jgi:uncharacterized protein
VYEAPKGRAAAAELVLAGGFPDAFERELRRRESYFESYVRTVVGRDMSDVGSVRIDSEKLGALLTLLAARTGGLVNYSALARDLALDDKTIKTHITLLTQLFLLYRLPPWSSNLGSRQVKTPKIFLCDSGLAAALIGADAERYSDPEQGLLAGMLFENFVLMELVKQATWSNARVSLYFYRDIQKREVDVLPETPAIEIKAGAGVGSVALRNLRFLRDRLGPRFKAGIVVYCGANTLPFGDRIWAVPVSGLWADDLSAL